MNGQPSSGVFRDGIHVLPIRIYYEDTDFTGVVYHANYLRYMERGRSDCLRALGLPHADLMSRGTPVAWTIVRIEIDYLKPARIDDALEVHTAYTRISGARLFASQWIKREGIDLVRAKVQAACITPEGRPARIPPEARERLERSLVRL